jgi:hypothetical protein
MMYQRSVLRHRSMPLSLRPRGIPNVTPQAVPHEAAMVADLDHSYWVLAGPARHDSSNALLAVLARV